MTDPRVEKLANVLVTYSVAVRPGDKVLVQGDALAEPLLRAVYVKVLQAGGHPLTLTSLPGMDELLFQHASDEQLQHVPEPIKMIMETYDVRISIRAVANTKALSGVNPSRMVMRSQATVELMKTFMERSASGEFFGLAAKDRGLAQGQGAGARHRPGDRSVSEHRRACLHQQRR